MLVSGIIIASFAFMLSPLLLYIRPSLTLSVASLRVLLLSLPFFFLTTPLMWQQITLHKEKTLFWIYFFAALGNTALNLSFAPHYGVLASAIITGITELFIYLSLLYTSIPSKLKSSYEITSQL